VLTVRSVHGPCALSLLGTPPQAATFTGNYTDEPDEFDLYRTSTLAATARAGSGPACAGGC